MILNPKIYEKAKQIADRTYKTHGAYKSAFLVKKYKELGGEYADDGKPHELTRWLQEKWQDVAGLPYPVYRPTVKVSKETPLTASEISADSLARNAVLKQIYQNEKNVPPFEAEGGMISGFQFTGTERRIPSEEEQQRERDDNKRKRDDEVGNFKSRAKRLLHQVAMLTVKGQTPSLSEAKSLLARIPFDELDSLGVNQIIDYEPLLDEVEKLIGMFGAGLTKRRITEFSQKLQNIFNFLSVSRKYRVVGSSALKEIKYNADYDLNELFEEKISDKNAVLNKLYEIFKKKFETAKKNPNIFITDFKCGENSDGEPLRWSYKDMMNGTKMLENGILVSFQDCLLMKATIKMDVIALIDGQFIEFSDNYFLKIGDDGNFFPHDMEPDHLMNTIRYDYEFYMRSARNYFKALKRLFAYYKMEGEGKNEAKLDKLVEFFNTETGLNYKLLSEIKTIQDVINQDFRIPELSDIRTNIRLILERLKGQDAVRKILTSTLKITNKKSILQYLEKASDLLFDKINDETIGFISQNKNLLLK